MVYYFKVEMDRKMGEEGEGESDGVGASFIEYRDPACSEM